MQKSSTTIKTPKGTSLPLLDFRGKEYLEVKYRLVWFHEEHPSWSIETELIERTPNSTVARATIKDDTGRVRSIGHKHEDKQGFADHMEKAETGAIGRALALIGYGTQFAPEFEEGERIVDSPTHRRSPFPGQYVIGFGKWKGKRLEEIEPWDLTDYCTFLKSPRDGKPPSAPANELLEAVKDYLETNPLEPKKDFSETQIIPQLEDNNHAYAVEFWKMVKHKAKWSEAQVAAKMADLFAKASTKELSREEFGVLWTAIESNPKK